MDFVQLARCAFGAHHRDRDKVWQDGKKHYSTCSGCGRTMIRTFGGWQLSGRDAPPAPPRED